MLEALANGSIMQKGLFVTIVGMIGVFIVLVLFYIVIRLFSKVAPNKQEKNNS